MAAANLDVSKKSYTIMLDIFRMLQLPYRPVVLDLTYGTGRFYWKIVEEYEPEIIAVDIVKHEWEIRPDIFIQKDARTLSLDDIRAYSKIDLIVVDPPWSHLKRGVVSPLAGYSKQPYHIKGVDPYSIINKAMELAGELRSTLVARFKEPLGCADILIRNHVVVFGRRGVVYYSICRW